MKPSQQPAETEDPAYRELSHRRLLWLFILLMVAIGIIGYAMFRHYEADAYQHEMRLLSTIADLKAEEITKWRQERIGDAETLARGPFFTREVANWVQSGMRADASRTLILERMELVRLAYDYREIYLFDASANLLLASSPGASQPVSHTVELVKEVIRTQRITFEDISLSDKRGTMGVIAPLVIARDGRPKCVGVVYLQIDPSGFLFPILKAMPLTSKSLEILLVRREDNDVLFLNLPPANGAGNFLRQPLSKRQLPAAIAVLGNTAEVEGVDYRGVPVFAALRKIPDSGWFLIAKVEQEEVYAPVRKQAWLAAGAVAALIALAGVAMGLWWRIQRARFLLAEHVRSEEGLRHNSAYSRSLIEASLDPLVTISAEGKITDVNDATVHATGVPRNLLIGSDFSDYFTEPEKARAGYRHVFDKGFVRDYPLSLRHKDGHIRDVLYNATVYRDDAGSILGVFAAARDVTERNKAGAALRDSEALMQTVMKALPVGLWIFDADGKIAFSNDAAQRIWAGVRYVGVEQLGEYKGWWVDGGKLVGAHEWAGARALEKGETSIEDEIEIECFDGTRKIILDSAVPLRGNDGSIRGAVTINQDITERKGLETKSRRSVAYTRSLIEASLDPLVTISAEGKVTDVNLATEAVTGRNRSELIGTDFSDYFTEPEKAREGYQQVFLKGSVTDYPLALRHRDGHITEVLYNASVYRDEAGEVLGVFAAARDVTERNKAEREVAQLSFQNRLILDSAGEGIYGMDIEGRCTFVNPAALQLLGFVAEDLVGQSSHSRFHHTKPDGSPYPVEECPVQAAYKQGVIHRGGDLYWRKDGSNFPVEFISTPILHAGKVSGAVVAFSDITERKRAEESIRVSQARFRTIFNQAPLGIALIDSFTGRIYEVNPRFAEIAGRTIEEMMTIDWMSITHPDDVQADLDNMTLLNAGKIPGFNMDKRYIRPDGSFVWINMTIAPLRMEQNISPRHLCMIDDITERKRIEEEMAQSEALFRNYFELGQMGMAITSLDQKWLQVNRRLCEILEYTREELVHMTWTELTYPDDLEPDLVQFKKLLSGEIERYSMEKRFFRKGGGIAYTYLAVSCQRKPDGAVDYVIASVQDITERKRAELEREQYFKFFNTATDLMGIADPNGAFKKVNPAFTNTLGYSEAELLAKPFIEFVHPEDRQATLDEMERQLQRGFSLNFENRYLCKDGSFRWMSWRANVNFDEGLTYATARDITENKEAEKKIRESEQKFRAMTDTSPLAIYMSSGIEQTAEYVNPTFTRLFGYKLEEVPTAAQWWPLAYPDEKYRKQVEEEWQRKVEQAIKTSSAIEPMDVVVTCKDGSKRNILWGYISTGVQNWAFGLDLTERKRAEEDLRRSEHGLAEAQRIAHLGNWELDLTTNRLMWSDEIYRIFEIDPEKFGASYEAFLNAIHPDDRDMVNNVYTESVKNKRPYEIVHRLLMKDGRVKYVNEKCETYYGEDGRPLSSVGTVHDITAQKVAEIALTALKDGLENRVKERTTELEGANKELESFAYSVSHDLRVPLRAIDGFSHLVLKHYEEKLDDEGKRLLGVVRDNTKKMAQLIDDILAFSRAGRLELKASETDMEALAREAWQGLEPLLANRDVRFDIKPLPKTQGDRAMLRQVFANLLSNAVKFTKPREVANIEIGSSAQDGEVVFYVKDNGVGFDMEYVGKLFGVFQRLHGVDEFEGTGIGLAIVKRIITRHGGRVWAEGRVNEGAAVYFSLPDHSREVG